ncbi:MAG: hypothetical protein OHK0015_00970 [Chloroflexi bacterium OHK40]
MTTNNDFDRTRTSGMGGTSGPSGLPAEELKDRAVEKAEELKDRAVEKAEELKDRASQAGQQAYERIDSAMTATGERMTDLAETVRQKAPGGQAGEVAHNAARVLEQSGTYLQRADPGKVRNDLERVIRDHPIEALAIGLGVGFLLGKSMSSRRNRYG